MQPHRRDLDAADLVEIRGSARAGQLLVAAGDGAESAAERLLLDGRPAACMQEIDDMLAQAAA